MALITKAVRGTQDLLPAQSHKWQYVENKCLEVAGLYGYKELRSPVFEHTELFQRSVGDTTDVVQKEMYTFEDKGGRSITLRPEGTAGAVRTFLEHGMYNDALPQKVCYLTSCYRYEKPQAGRLREFHQFGVECFGAAGPAADAELISIAAQLFESLGVENLCLQINSIGCPDCRAKYYDALRAYFKSHEQELCSTCLNRLERNPMRILDCKSPVCSEIAAHAPVVLDYICDDCRAHFTAVQDYLEAMGIDFMINPTIVRGLDYYTRTVFEFVSSYIGAQGTVCGGGRYDGLVKEMGGPDMPSLGFAMGLERLMMLLENQGCEFPEPMSCELYIAAMGEDASRRAAVLAHDLRAEGFSVQMDIAGRGLKAQMKYADKIGAKYAMVLGDSELESGTANLKDMKNGHQIEVRLDELVERFYDINIEAAMENITEDIELSEGKINKILGGLG